MFNWAKRSMKSKSFYTRKKKGQPDSAPAPPFPQSRKVSSESLLGGSTANTSDVNPETTIALVSSGQRNESSKTEAVKSSDGGSLLEEKSSDNGNHSEKVVKVPIMLSVSNKQAVNSAEAFNKESNYTTKNDPRETVYPKELNPFGDEETEGEETQSTLSFAEERTTEYEVGSPSKQNGKFCTRVPSEMVGKNPFDSESDSEDGGAAAKDESRQADRNNKKVFAVNHSEATAVENNINSNCVNATDKSEQSCDIKIHITSPPVSGATGSQSSVSAHSEDSLSRPNMKMGGSLPTTPTRLRSNRMQSAHSFNVLMRDVPLAQNMASEKEAMPSNQAEILPKSLNPFDEVNDDGECEKENKENCANGPVTVQRNFTTNESKYICGFQENLELDEKLQAQQSTDTILTSSSGVSSLSINNPFENDDDISVIEDTPQITTLQVNANINNKFLPQKTSSPLPKARTSYSPSKVSLPTPLPRKSRQQSHHGSVSSVLSPSISRAGTLQPTLQKTPSSSAPSINSNTVSRSQSVTVLCQPNPTTQSNQSISKNPFQEDEDSNPEENMPSLQRGSAGRSSASNINNTNQTSVSNAGSKQQGVTDGFQRFGLRASLPPSTMNFKKKKRHAPLPPTNQQQNSTRRPADTSLFKLQNDSQELSYGKNYSSPHTIKKKPPPRPPPPRLNATS